MFDRQSTMTTARQRFLRAGAIGLAVLGSSLGSLTPAAAIDIPSPWEVHRQVDRQVRRTLRALSQIPERLAEIPARHLEEFFDHEVYYRPHGHRHQVYAFPVWESGRVVSRPYAYCDDHRFYESDSYAPERYERGWAGQRSGRTCADCGEWYESGRRHACDSDRYGRYERDRYDRDRYDDRAYGRGRSDRARSGCGRSEGDRRRSDRGRDRHRHDDDWRYRDR